MAVASVANAQLIITGIVDDPLTGGIPKCIELYACDDIADLPVYGIGSVNIPGTSLEEFTFPLGNFACDPAVPAQEASWGDVKALFR